MKVETILLFAVPIVSIFSLLFVPKNKFFQAQFIFLFVQLLTWILGLSAVELGFIKYPYRELYTVNRTSFIFEYIVLPIMCIHFNVFFPEASSKTVKSIYTFGITLIFTIIEYFVEKYTEILKYTGWKLYWTFISILLVFWISRLTTRWFFNNKI